MIDLNHVALFANVVEAGSFSGAARALGMPKATLSRSVARLEADLGARLLHRTTRKLELTAVGRAYYEEAASGLGRLQAANEQAAAAQTVPSGTLRITAPVAYAIHNLMGWLPEFLAAHAQVKVELRLTDDYVDLIEERIDVAFRTGKLASSSLIARRLGPARRILVASPAYLGQRGMPARIADLAGHDCVVFGPSLENAVWRLDGPDGPEEIAVSGRIAVDSAHAALSAAVAGLGVALLPLGLAADALEEGRLRPVLPRYGVDGGGAYVVYPSNRHVSAALRAFLDFVGARAGAALR